MVKLSRVLWRSGCSRFQHQPVTVSIAENHRTYSLHPLIFSATACLWVHISFFSPYLPHHVSCSREFSGLLIGNANKINSSGAAVCPTELFAGHLSHAATPAGLWRVEPWTNPWMTAKWSPWYVLVGGFLAKHEPKSVVRTSPNMRFKIWLNQFYGPIPVLELSKPCTIPRGWNPTIAALFSLMQAKSGKGTCRGIPAKYCRMFNPWLAAVFSKWGLISHFLTCDRRCCFVQS